MSAEPHKHSNQRLLLRSQEYFEAGFPLFIQEVEQSAMKAHAHDFFEMVYVRRGCGTHYIGKQEFSLRAGDVFIIHPGEKHSYQPLIGAPLRIVNILWQPELVREVLILDSQKNKKTRNFKKLDDMSLSQSLPYIEPLFKVRSRFHHHLHLSGSSAFRVEVLLDEMRREAEAAREGRSAPGCHALLRHLFCALLVLLSRVQQDQSSPNKLGGRNNSAASPRAAQQDAVARSIAFLETHLQTALRVDDVAAHVALSSSRLAHLFKQQTGRSIVSYLNEIRVEKACGLLKAVHTDTQPIHQIAAECGFTDLRFFHRVFRRICGCSPAQYRQRKRSQ